MARMPCRGGACSVRFRCYTPLPPTPRKRREGESVADVVFSFPPCGGRNADRRSEGWGEYGACSARVVLPLHAPHPPPPAPNPTQAEGRGEGCGRGLFLPSLWGGGRKTERSSEGWGAGQPPQNSPFVVKGFNRFSPDHARRVKHRFERRIRGWHGSS